MSSSNGQSSQGATTPASNNGNTPSNDTETRRRRNNNTNNRSNNNNILSNPKNYEGSIPDVCAILALKHESLDKKVQYQVFVDKVGNYIYSNVKNGGDLIPLFKDIIDPRTEFDNKRKPVKLTEDQLKDSLEVDIYKEEVKLYVSSKSVLIRNIEKAHGIIWGQCSSPYNQKLNHYLTLVINLVISMPCGSSRNSKRPPLE